MEDNNTTRRAMFRHAALEHARAHGTEAAALDTNTFWSQSAYWVAIVCVACATALASLPLVRVARHERSVRPITCVPPGGTGDRLDNPELQLERRSVLSLLFGRDMRREEQS